MNKLMTENFSSIFDRLTIIEKKISNLYAKNHPHEDVVHVEVE
jgi:hypothetical protein